MEPPGNDNQRGNNKQKDEEKEKAREQEARNNMLTAILTQEARARLATLGAAKPERARMVEDIIIRNMRMGAIRGKVDEDSLRGLLEKVQEQTAKREPKVTYERRRVFDDSDEDEDYD